MKPSSDNGPGALVAAFHAIEPMIRRFVRRFTLNAHDVDDICQETITRALEARRARVVEEPRGFLFGVARNVVRKRLDKQSRALIDFVEDFATREFDSGEVSLEAALDSQQRLLIFIDAVATLPPQCQQVFVMKKVYGYGHQAIADQLGISVSTVEKHVGAGLRRCLDEMEKRSRSAKKPRSEEAQSLR